MKPRMKTQAGLILSACFALQATPISVSSVAAADTEHPTTFSLPQNRLSYVDTAFVPFATMDFKNQMHSSVDARAYAGFITRRTRELLPVSYKSKASRIAQVLIQESNRYQMDPLFLMAMIEHESQFRPDARGSHGEIGLMQIKPTTVQWLAIHHGGRAKGDTSLLQLSKMLANPSFNIRCGAAYLAALKKSFHGRPELYLAAYNRGPGSVRALLRSSEISDQQFAHNTGYSAAVMDNYRLLAHDFIGETQPKITSVVAADRWAQVDFTHFTL